MLFLVGKKMVQIIFRVKLLKFSLGYKKYFNFHLTQIILK